MAEITKLLPIAASDFDAGFISAEQFHSILQEAIDNGDILEPENELIVVGTVFPLLDIGVLKRSEYIKIFEERMSAKLSERIREEKGVKIVAPSTPSEGGFVSNWIIPLTAAAGGYAVTVLIFILFDVRSSLANAVAIMTAIATFQSLRPGNNKGAKQ